MTNKRALVPMIMATLCLTAGTAFAADQAQGPEPYSAPTPQYAPMTSEPLVQKTTTAPAPVLTDNGTTNGPAAGPEPYSAPTPSYQPMTSEPVLQPEK